MFPFLRHPEFRQLLKAGKRCDEAFDGKFTGELFLSLDRSNRCNIFRYCFVSLIVYLSRSSRSSCALKVFSWPNLFTMAWGVRWPAHEARDESRRTQSRSPNISLLNSMRRRRRRWQRTTHNGERPSTNDYASICGQKIALSLSIPSPFHSITFTLLLKQKRHLIRRTTRSLITVIWGNTIIEWFSSIEQRSAWLEIINCRTGDAVPVVYSWWTAAGYATSWWPQKYQRNSPSQLE